MNFTREDILKIKWALDRYSVKDSELLDADFPMQYNDTISIVLNGVNKKISIKEFIWQVGLLAKDGIFNVTDIFNKPNITLNEAIKIIPYSNRKEGLVITFLDENGEWRIYQFRGDITQFNNETLWKDLYDFTEYIVNSVLPDEEDLTLTPPNIEGNSFIKLKDKEYNLDNFSGLGKVILRKNIIEVEDPTYGKIKKNILYQDMINKSNTIYVIQYDFTLGEDITIPENCVLKFDGGSVNGDYTVDFNKCYIDYSSIKIGMIAVNIDDSVNHSSRISNNIVYPEWFKHSNETDYTYAFRRAFDVLNSGTVLLTADEYALDVHEHPIISGLVGVVVRDNITLESTCFSRLYTTRSVRYNTLFTQHTGNPVNFTIKNIFIDCSAECENAITDSQLQFGNVVLGLPYVNNLYVENCKIISPAINMLYIGAMNSCYINNNIFVFKRAHYNNDSIYDASAVYLETSCKHTFTNNTITGYDNTEFNICPGGMESHGHNAIISGNSFSHLTCCINVINNVKEEDISQISRSITNNKCTDCNTFCGLWAAAEDANHTNMSNVFIGNNNIEIYRTALTVVHLGNAGAENSSIKNIVFEGNKVRAKEQNITNGRDLMLYGGIICDSKGDVELKVINNVFIDLVCSIIKAGRYGVSGAQTIEISGNIIDSPYNFTGILTSNESFIEYSYLVVNNRSETKIYGTGNILRIDNITNYPGQIVGSSVIIKDTKFIGLNLSLFDEIRTEPSLLYDINKRAIIGDKVFDSNILKTCTQAGHNINITNPKIIAKNHLFWIECDDTSGIELGDIVNVVYSNIINVSNKKVVGLTDKHIILEEIYIEALMDGTYSNPTVTFTAPIFN